MFSSIGYAMMRNIHIKMGSLFAILTLMVEHLQKMIFSRMNTFMASMQELTKLKDVKFFSVADNHSQIKLKGNKYYVCEGTKGSRLWLIVRKGIPSVKDDPSIEIMQTYNLSPYDQIVGMMMKSLLLDKKKKEII